VKKTFALIGGMVGLAVVVGFCSPLAAGDDASDELVQMVVGLLNESDREMRTLGLQQVRTEAKGTAATRRFAALLPKLPPERQAELIAALGGRGDPAARPAVVEMLGSKEASVRAAAIGALGSLGALSDIALLVRKLAASTDSEKTAALEALTRLSAPGANAAIAEEPKRAKPAEIRAKLLGVLAARNATESIPAILDAAKDAEAEVRLAALSALKTLADPAQTAAIVGLVKAAKDEEEQDRAEAALVAVVGRGGQAGADAVRAGIEGAAPRARVALLRALARAGGPKSLEAIVAATKDQEKTVRDEAVRLLASWPDASAAEPLLAIARQSETLRPHVLAVQGLVRLASPVTGRPANLDVLAEALKIAKRREEKRIVLGVLGSIPTAQSLALILPAMDDPELADEACLAGLLLAENPAGLDKPQRRAAAEKAAAKAKTASIRQRAEKLLKSL